MAGKNSKTIKNDQAIWIICLNLHMSKTNLRSINHITLFRLQFNMIFFVDTQFCLCELQHYHARDARWIKLVTHILSWVNRFQFELNALKQIKKIYLWAGFYFNCKQVLNYG